MLREKRFSRIDLREEKRVEILIFCENALNHVCLHFYGTFAAMLSLATSDNDFLVHFML